MAGVADPVAQTQDVEYRVSASHRPLRPGAAPQHPAVIEPPYRRIHRVGSVPQGCRDVVQLIV